MICVEVEKGDVFYLFLYLMRVIVASQNPVKIKAVQDAYATFLPELPVETVGVQVASGVADQPMSDDETLQGAWQRASNAQEAYP